MFRSPCGQPDYLLVSKTGEYLCKVHVREQNPLNTCRLGLGAPCKVQGTGATCFENRGKRGLRSAPWGRCGRGSQRQPQDALPLRGGMCLAGGCWWSWRVGKGSGRSWTCPGHSGRASVALRGHTGHSPRRCCAFGVACPPKAPASEVWLLEWWSPPEAEPRGSWSRHGCCCRRIQQCCWEPELVLTRWLLHALAS